MRISTGLVPDWRRVPLRKPYTLPEEMPVPTSALDVAYQIDFRLPKHTVDAPKGTIVNTLVVRDEPKITTKGFTIAIYDEMVDPEKYLEWEVQKYNPPKDAQYEKRLHEFGHGTLHAYNWYEVEV